MVKDSRPGFGGDEVKWPRNWRERLESTKWQPHVVLAQETTSRWEQTAPIPTFHRIETSFDGEVSVHHLMYLFAYNRLGYGTVGRTVEEAEANMRDGLSFNIELGIMIRHKAPFRITFTPETYMADEVSQYYRQKPEQPQK